MKTTFTVLRRTGLALAIGACLPASALAGTAIEQLQQQVETLQSQLQAIQAQLAEQQAKSASKDDVQALKKEVKEVANVHSEEQKIIDNKEEQEIYDNFPYSLPIQRLDDAGI